MRLLRCCIFGIVALISASFAFSFVNYGPVKRGDTLWRIAMKYRPSSKTNLFEMMKAIKVLNPSAFGSDESILRVGVSLKLPSTNHEIHQAVFSHQAPQESMTPQVPATFSKTPTSQRSNKSHSTNEVVHQNQALSHQLREQASTQLTGAGKVYGVSQSRNRVAKSDLNQHQASTPRQLESTHSVWSYLWFAIILGLLGYIFYHRRRLFASLQSGNDMAARRLGLNRSEPSVKAYKTQTLWQDKKPNYAKGSASGSKEGEAMAAAMIDMAEGHYSEAKQTLIDATQQDPHNLDLRMKLLDVYVALNDSTGYKAESDYILEHMITENDPRWNKIRSAYLRKWAYDPS